jgi:hypothetical protein
MADCRRTSPRRAICAIAIAGLAAFAAPAAAAALTPASDPFFGIVIQQRSLSDAEIGKMARGRVGTVRLVLNWQQLEPTEGNFELGAADARFSEIERAGARPLPVIYGQPEWLGDPRQAPLGSARAEDSWTQLLTTLAERYGNGGTLAAADPEFVPVAAWQIWNEPNLPSFWIGEAPNAAHYTRLLQLSAPALHAADPEAEVIAAGLSPAPKGVPPRKFMRGIYAEYERLGAAPDFDELALNPYAGSVRESREQIAKFTRVAADEAPGMAPQLMISEIGWGSAGPQRSPVSGTAETQARRLRRTFALVRRKRESWRLSSVLWYAWRDLPADSGGCVFCEHIGLFDAAGEAKPAWRAFRDMQR